MKKILALMFCLLLAVGAWTYADGISDDGIGGGGISDDGIGGDGINPASGGPSGDALLLETGDYLLLETGDKLLLE